MPKKRFFLSFNLLQLLMLGNPVRFHFMNKNIYLAMLIFCSCRSRRYGREQLFCPIKIYSNISDEMQKHYTFKRVFLQYRTSTIQYFSTTPERFERLSTLSATASGGVQMYSSSCIFVLEVVLTIKKHSEFKHFYTYPEVIE